jgi:hypothetical protein
MTVTPMKNSTSCEPARRHTFSVFLLFFASALSAYAQGNIFKHVRYNGGTFYTNVKPSDWHNQLTITSDTITFKLHDDQEIQILSKLVTALSYGEDASHQYFIGIQYTSPKGEKAGLLLQGDKRNYRAILEALQSVTSLPIAVNENNRASMPLGLKTTPSAGDLPTGAKSAAQLEAEAKATQYGNLTITSDPQDADVFVDGTYVGITPATMDLIVGMHSVRVSRRGYADWSREINVLVRSKLSLAAILDKQEPPPQPQPPPKPQG